MDRKIGKKEEVGELECSRCGFKNANCLKYVDHELLCQNCIYLKQTEKEREAQNLSDLIKEVEEEDGLEEEFGGTVKPPEGFTLVITAEDLLIPRLN